MTDERKIKIFSKIHKIAIISIVCLVVLYAVLFGYFCSNKGSVEGTSFVRQQYAGLNVETYGVSPEGDIFVSAHNTFGSGTNVYDGAGNYKYSLGIDADKPVRFDEYGNILIYKKHSDSVNVYSSSGEYIESIHRGEKEFNWDIFDFQAKQSSAAAEYILMEDTIYKVCDDEAVVPVVSRPWWDIIMGIIFPYCIIAYIALRVLFFVCQKVIRKNNNSEEEFSENPEKTEIKKDDEYTPEERKIVDDINARIVKLEESFMKGIKITWKILFFAAIGLVAVYFATLGIYNINYGNVEGTGFVNQRYAGTYEQRYRVNEDGDIFIVAKNPFSGGVNIFDENGKFRHSLARNADSVNFDKDGNILLHIDDEYKTEVYSPDGYYMDFYYDYEEKYDEEMFFNEEEQSAGGTNYIYEDEAIFKEDANGEFVKIIESSPLESFLITGLTQWFVFMGIIAAACYVFYEQSVNKVNTIKGLPLFAAHNKKMFSYEQIKELYDRNKIRTEQKYLKQYYEQKEARPPVKKDKKHCFTDNKSRRYVRYAIAFGIAAAAILAVLLYVPAYFGGYKGNVENTGYVYQEYPELKMNSYRVSPSGDIYVFANDSKEQGINIYDENGNYKYSLSEVLLNADSIMFYENGDFLLDCPDYEIVNVFNSRGEFTDIIYYEKNESHDEYFSYRAEQNVDGKTYICEGDAIYRVQEDGAKEKIIEEPVWYTVTNAMFPIGFIIPLALAAMCLCFAVKNKKHADKQRKR